ncbi:MAG TPA: hypothetical protein VNQ90_15845 [Chthoniobacteraceae bacterium]|nr:hypothetical protein [Chthoniobacteraceae bacterium]
MLRGIVRKGAFGFWLCALYLACLAAGASAASVPNLVQDPSFESGLSPWLETDRARPLHAEVYPSAQAPDGRRVLAASGWDDRGGALLSPPIVLDGTEYAVSLDLRNLDAGEAQVEVLLVDEGGKRALATLGVARLTAERGWVSLRGHGELAPADAPRKGRLALRFQGGPAKVEIDRLGLFPGAVAPEVSHPVVVRTFAALELAAGRGWQRAEAPEGYYTDAPLSAALLSGAARLPEGEEAEGAATVEIPAHGGGSYRLWMRFLTTKGMPGSFTVELQQEGVTLAAEEIDAADPRFGAPWSWHWISLSGVLQPGTARVLLKRPAASSARTARLVDFFLLTNLSDYRPLDADFRPACYVRFTPDGEGDAPYCLFFTVHRPRGPHYYRTPGMLTRAGFSRGYTVPRDRRQWLHQGKPGPWVRLDDELLPDSRVRGNLLHITATRGTHLAGWVGERFRGLLEFATGEERTVYQSIEVDQQGARLFCTARLTGGVYAIRSATDYLRASREAVASLPAAQPALPQPQVEVLTSLHLEEGRDDADLIAGEVAVLRRLGIYNTNRSLAPPARAEAFQEKMGLLPVFRAEGTLRALDGSQNTPDFAAMDAHFRETAHEMEPILDKVRRIKLMDEPQAMSYEELAASPASQAAFREWIKGKPFPSAEPPRLVLPGEKERHPELFYYTGLFRLETFASYLKAASASAHRHFPPHALTYANLAPAFARTWVETGQDPFLIYRDHGLGLLWSEDWIGNGASLQQLSDYLALYRAAARPGGQPLGGYCVVTSAGNATRLRLNAYQWLAAGARVLHFYSYGPSYSGVDSWAGRYDLYPAVGALGREIRALDGDLKGLVRRPARVAILFNRTAGIWEGAASLTEMDARFIHWALAHLGYDADFLPEEDLHALSRYRVLYLNGVQLRRDAAGTIARWVEAGGTVVGTAGAGTRDEWNRPLERLEEVFGITGSALEVRERLGQPRFAARDLSPLGRVDAVGEAAPGWERRGLVEALEPAGKARITLQTPEGEPAGVAARYGKGAAHRWGALPGLAYLVEAMEASPSGAAERLPHGYRRELARWIAAPVARAGVEPVAVSSAPLATVVRWDHPASPSPRSLFYVIDFSGRPAPEFEMVVSGAFTRARSPRGTQITLQPLPEGRTRVRFPLDVADAVVLEP